MKQKVKQSESHTLTRAGYSVSGSPANLNLVRTMRNSLSRRIALKRPKRDEIRELEEMLREAEEADTDADGVPDVYTEPDAPDPGRGMSG